MTGTVPGYFRLPPFPRSLCILPGLFDSVSSCFVARARLAMKYGDTKLILFLVLLERLLHDPHPTKWALGQSQPLLGR